jgi:hypothetical protein
MIAIANFFSSFDEMQASSNSKEVFEYANSYTGDYSGSFLSNIAGMALPVGALSAAGKLATAGTALASVNPWVAAGLLLPLSVYDSSEVYFNDKCVGFYYKNNIDQEKHLVTYDLKLYDKSVLPKDFDFHFEPNGILNKVGKFFMDENIDNKR